MSFNDFLTLYLAKAHTHTHTHTHKNGHTHSNKVEASATDLLKQMHPLCITAKERSNIIVHLKNENCRKLMSYHQ